MNTKALRQKVLDLAIHGKLVPQNPNDESAEVLLKKIREEKAEKIKKGELKADKKDSFIFTKECEFDEDKLGKCSSGTRHKRHYEQFADGTVKDIEDEIPFEVPEGWAWCRLTNVAITELGKTLDAKKNKGESYDYLCALNVKWYTFDFTTLKQIRLEEKEKERYLVRKGDLLICEGGDVGRSAIWESDNPIYYQNALHRVRFYQNINQYFFLHVLNYYKNIGLIDDVSGGVTIKHFTQNSMQKLLFPLPPLAEQERIVSVIKNIFSQIDTLDQNKSDLQTAINKTKSKILDLAIHGKLVPQDPNDEPAEELLKRIATSDNRPYEKVEEGDIPFEIPPSWKWTTIKNIVNYIGDGDWIESKDQSDKGIRLIQTGNIGFGTFKDKEGKYHYISENTFSRLGCNEIFEGDILISRLPEPVGRACILPKVPERMITAVDCTIIRLNEELFQKELFVYYTISNKYLELIKENCTGTTRLRISRSNLEKIFIPIPPLNEQKRILNRIKKLFETLDEIILNLV